MMVVEAIQSVGLWDRGSGWLRQHPGLGGGRVPGGRCGALSLCLQHPPLPTASRSCPFPDPATPPPPAQQHHFAFAHRRARTLGTFWSSYAAHAPSSGSCPQIPATRKQPPPLVPWGSLPCLWSTKGLWAERWLTQDHRVSLFWGNPVLHLRCPLQLEIVASAILCSFVVTSTSYCMAAGSPCLLLLIKSFCYYRQIFSGCVCSSLHFIWLLTESSNTN